MADVVVVGGGIVGLAVAVQLRRMGVADVVVLERNQAVGQGSSARANGGIRAQFSTVPNIEFSRYSLVEYEWFSHDSRGELGFHQIGYLLLAGTEKAVDALRAACELQRSMGIGTAWLTPDEAVSRVPFLRADGLRAATYHSRDGFLDPHAAVTLMARETRWLRVPVHTGAEVTSLRRRNGGFAVSSTAGDFTCDWVVNAAGADAARVAGLLSVEVPVHPVRRNLAYAEVPGESDEDPAPLIPMCVDLDTGVLVRREVGGGYVLAYSNPDDPPGRDTTVDPDFLPQLAARIGHRFPHLEAVPINPRQCWAGLYPETPDHHAVIGVPPEAPGFVQCVGFGGHGLMHAPAAGLAVAELVTQGRCTSFDLHPLRPTRFAEGDLMVESAVF